MATKRMTHSSRFRIAELPGPFPMSSGLLILLTLLRLNK